MAKANFGEHVAKIVELWNQHKYFEWINHPPVDWAKPPARLLAEIKRFSAKVGDTDWQILSDGIGNAIRMWVAKARYNDTSYEWTLTQALNSDKLYHYYIKSRQSPASAEVKCRWQPELEFLFLGRLRKIHKVDGIIVSFTEEGGSFGSCTTQYLDTALESGWITFKEEQDATRPVSGQG